MITDLDPALCAGHAQEFSYMACGCPIIASLSGEGARILEEAGAGIVAPAQNPELLAAAIEKMADIGEQERKAMGPTHDHIIMHIAAILLWKFGMIGVILGGFLIGFIYNFSDKILSNIKIPFRSGLLAVLYVLFILLMIQIICYNNSSIFRPLILTLIIFLMFGMDENEKRKYNYQYYFIVFIAL